MPYSIIHLESSVKFLEWKDLDKQDYLDFIVWGLLVDSSYDLNRKWVEFITRDHTHYHVWQDWFTANFTDTYFEKEFKNDLKNSLKQGYYYHLLIDKFYRDFEWKEILLNIDINTDSDIEYLYEVYRKINAKQDLFDFIDYYWKDIINDLYNYEVDTSKLPSCFSWIDASIIKTTLIDILDYMTFKKSFMKFDLEKNYYEIFEWEIKLKDNILEKYNNYFSREDYIKMKEKAFKIDIEL